MKPTDPMKQALAGKLSQPLNNDDYIAISRAAARLVVDFAEGLRQHGTYGDVNRSVRWMPETDLDAALRPYRALLDGEVGK